MTRYPRILLLSILVLAGCSLDPLVFRISSDYMPADKIGNTWVYALPDSGEKTVSIVSSDLRLGKECVRVQVDFEDQYWYRDEIQFDVYSQTVYLFNEEFVIEERWARRLVLPLVRGNKWQDRFENTIDVYGQPVKRTVTSKGEVVSIVDVTVPAGRFEQCYRVRYESIGETETPYGNGQVDSVFVEEYYAPDVGLVRRVNLLTSQEELLTSYSVE